MPAAAKADAEIQALWSIAQHLWKRDVASAYRLIMDTRWTEPVQQLSIKLLGTYRILILAEISSFAKSVGCFSPHIVTVLIV